MLLISIFILIMAIAINYKQVLNSYLFIRLGFIIFALTGAISLNALYIQSIGSGMGIYSGLFQITSITQFFDLFIFTMGALIFLAWPRCALQSSRACFASATDANADPRSATHASQALEDPSFAGSLKNYPREYSLVALISTLGASLLISSSDLISLYLSIELQSFGVYILATIYRNIGSAVSAGLKYFLLGSLSSCIILLGATIIYTYTGLTHFDSIYSFITITENQSIIQGISLGIVLMFIGFFFKIGAAPLHNWSPDVYDGSPNIVTQWLTIMPKISLLIIILDMYLNLGIIEYNVQIINSASSASQEAASAIPASQILKNLILISSIISLIIGSTVGLSQIRIKRLLAYSTISHLGFILLAISINTEQSVESLIFYIIQYSLTNLNIFLIILAVGILVHSSAKGIFADIQYIDELKGLFFYNPILSISLSICLFSMAGIPPLIGFFSKQFVLYAAIQKGFYFISIIAIIVSVISASYYLNIIKILHLRPSSLNSNLKIKTCQDKARSCESGGEWNINSTHSFVISTLTLSILLFILKPSILLNSTAMLSLTFFHY